MTQQENKLHTSKSKAIAVISLLGTLAFVSNGFLPSPIDKVFIVIQALCFSLAAILVPKVGATSASFVTGLLLSVLRVGFFPFSLLFSLFFGLLIDASFNIFKVRKGNIIRPKRLILLLTVSTAITGIASMYITTMLGLIPMLPFIYLAIIVFAIPNGTVAGILSVLLWKRYVHNLS